MPDDRFDEWLRTQAQHYNSPPPADTDAMWQAIETQHFDAPVARTPWWGSSWVRLAAALFIGVGLGRISVERTPAAGDGATDGTASTVAAPSTVMSDPATLRYIGQTVALLASFESDVPVIRGDSAIKLRAQELLLTTRLLLDSQNSADPIVYTLLEDLELVLVQIVQMPPKRNASDVDLIKEAMDQREVMPRLIAAVSNTTSAE
jgi:hypothetical protein